MPIKSMAEAIKKVRLKTTLVLRLIWKRFIDVLFPPVLRNNGRFISVLEILQNIEKILQCKVHYIPGNHMQQACLGAKLWSIRVLEWRSPGCVGITLVPVAKGDYKNTGRFPAGTETGPTISNFEIRLWRLFHWGSMFFAPLTFLLAQMIHPANKRKTVNRLTASPTLKLSGSKTTSIRWDPGPTGIARNK